MSDVGSAPGAVLRGVTTRGSPGATSSRKRYLLDTFSRKWGPQSHPEPPKAPRNAWKPPGPSILEPRLPGGVGDPPSGDPPWHCLS